MKTILTLFVTSLFLGSVAFPLPTYAQTDYQMLAPIPGLVKSGNSTDIKTFIPGVAKLMIGLAAAFAVFMLIWGGIQYMSTDAVSGKSDGRETITNAVIGLLLAIGAFTILNTINPRLLTLDLKLPYVGSTAPIGTDLGLATDDPNKIDPIGATGCSTCAPMPAQNVIPSKPVGQGCKAPGPCVVSAPLMDKLTRLNIALKGKNPPITWQVTEMFPPTVEHKDSCHQNGTCVDGKLFAVTTGRLIILLTEIEKIFGKNYEYEVCDQTRLATLRNDLQLSQFKDRFKCESTTVGSESFHVEI